MAAEGGGERGRLRWRCRRGMLELDELLGGFVDGGGYDALTPAQRAAFERLLATEDQRLMSWLLAGERPTDGELTDLVERIRAHARARP
ncbi:succinate dehydrogenase assembly factor 2 [Inmirania thermothiophila]|uniref:FAD assembly factor SdhE n=1 Tax=Inmirania thermothiophila TaxID=1750597 RepID=A0A3N1XZX0_9GAMM|nr:succinate dehydrogenase assembly factor 2 [Inmirania thermothiophila]ROR32119.1 antitoxin CptB [Inmirania thermothiophila]